MSGKYAQRYSTDELMAVTIARDMKDDEIGFVGLGTGGRASQLAVGIPLAAGLLAQMTHAPDFNIIFGTRANPKGDQVPKEIFQSSIEVLNWEYLAHIPPSEIFDLFRSGRLSIGFVSGAQIDQYGNLNIVSIGDYNNPKVRLVGCLLQTEHMSFAERNIIPIEHNKRTFVPKVDFISGAGYLDGGNCRDNLGLIGGGPKMIVTNLAILDFEERSKKMRIKSIHPGRSISEIQENTGFELIIPDEIPQTEPPTKKQLNLLRNVIDKDNILMMHN